MGGESVHAAIERKLRNIPVYLPSDFLEASQLEKYEVKQLSFDFAKDYAEKSTLMYLDSILGQHSSREKKLETPL